LADTALKREHQTGMGNRTYIWRKLTPKQQEELLAWRKHQGLPWHRPPHCEYPAFGYGKGWDDPDL